MLHRKLLELLTYLSREEHQRLRLFLQSPYFVANPAAFRLYTYLALHLARPEKLNREAAALAAFETPLAPASLDKKLDQLSSELFGLVKTFLGQEALAPDLEFRGMLQLAQRYRRHYARERFEQNLLAMRRWLEKYPFRDKQYFRWLYQLEEEASEFRQLYFTLEDNPHHILLDAALDRQYLLEKLDAYTVYAFHRRYTEPPEEHPILGQWILAQSRAGLGHDLPQVACYLALAAAQEQPDSPEAFDHLVQTVDQHRAVLPADICRNMYSWIRTFWAGRNYQPADPASREAFFQLYRQHFEAGYLSLDGGIIAPMFRVLIQSALRQGYYDWAKSTLDQYSAADLRGTQYPEELYRLFYAEYYFAIQDFPRAEAVFVHQNFENQSFNVIFEILQIKIYYETGNELLDFRMKAVEQKIRRMRIKPEFKNRTLAFLKALYTLLRYGWGKQQPKRERILKMIRETSNMVDREWLLAKLEQGPAFLNTTKNRRKP